MVKKRIYIAVNLCVLLLTFVLFALLCVDSYRLLLNLDWQGLAALLIAVVVIHGLKALRLYFEFYEFSISFGVFLKQYCKVLPVSLLFPFKSGDLFRGYSYGYAIGNYSAGFSVVILDRFVDTLALILVMLILSVSWGIHLSLVFYLLLAFLGLLTLIYFRLPAMCRYWKKYIIKTKASRRTVPYLRGLESLQDTMNNLETVVRGKFLITFLISIVAWVVEIGGLMLYCDQADQYDPGVVSAYLADILTGNQNEYLLQFILLSVLIFALLYAGTRVTLSLRKRKPKE